MRAGELGEGDVGRLGGLARALLAERGVGGEHRTLGRQAAQAAQAYAWPEIAARIASVYEEVLVQRPLR